MRVSHELQSRCSQVRAHGLVHPNAVVNPGWGCGIERTRWGVGFAQARTSGLRDARIRFKEPSYLVPLSILHCLPGVRTQQIQDPEK